MQKYIDFTSDLLLDVGSNTGFFTLSLAHQYPESIFTALEGNEKHAAYIRLIAEVFKFKNVKVIHKYLDFSALKSLGNYRTILLFNVLHHAGVDFDQNMVRSKDYLHDYIFRYLQLAYKACDRMLVQMGYNWGGNKAFPVVDVNDDIGKIMYTGKALRSAGWHIKSIAIPRKTTGLLPVEHVNLPVDLVAAVDRCDDSVSESLLPLLDPEAGTFSEFYRRPIFLCERY